MPLDLSCPQCEHVFPVQEARHPVGVQCPECNAGATAEFRRVPVPNPGESPYELVVTPGLPAGASRDLPDGGKKPLALDDEDDGPRRGGGSMAMVVIVGVIALALTLGGLGAVGYLLFTNLDTTPSTTNRGGSFTGGSGNTSKGGNSGIPGTPNPKKTDRFNLEPTRGSIPAITPTKLDASGTASLMLPGSATTIRVGGGGRYLVMLIQDKSLVVVVDVSTAEIVAQQQVDGGPSLLAAGANRVVVWAGAMGKIRVYDLPGLNHEHDGSCALFHGPRAMAMGNRTNGPLLMIDPFGEVVLHDVNKNGSPLIEGSQGQPGVHGGGGLRASADGKVFATLDRFDSQSRVAVLSEFGNKWKATKDTFPAPYPAERGDTFYGVGGAMDKNGGTINLGTGGFGTNPPNQWFVPATSGGYFLKLVAAGGPPAGGPRTFTVTVHTNRKGDSPVAKLAPITGIPADGLIDHWDVPLDHHFILVPEAKVLMHIPANKDRIQLQRVDLR